MKIILSWVKMYQYCGEEAHEGVKMYQKWGEKVSGLGQKGSGVGSQSVRSGVKNYQELAEKG